MTDLADIHDIVEHLRKHTLGGEHDEEQVVDALVRVMDRRPDLRKLLKPGDVAFLRAKRAAKGRYAFDESQHPRGQPENAGEFAPKGGGVAVSQPQQGQSQEQPRGNARNFAQDSLGVIHRFANELLASNPQAAANAAASAKQLFQGYFEKLKQQAGPNHDAGKMKAVGRKLSKEYMDLENELSSGTFADTARREGMPVAIKELHQAFMDAKSLTGYEFENQFGEGSLDGMAGEENAAQPSGENGEFGDSWDEQESVAFLQKYHDTPIKTKDDAQAAFRKAVLATHPDRGGDSAEFHKVRRAKDVLRFSVDSYSETQAAQYARDWNDRRAAGRNVSRDEITAAASDLAGTGVYVAWNASDDAPGWEAVPASVVDAVMGRYARDGEPGGGVMFGGEVHTGDDEQERIHLIADILHGVYGDDVMSMFDDTGRYSREPDGRYAKWGPEEAAQHPRGPNGQFVKRGTGEAATATLEKVRNALKGGGTAKELAGHLDLLTVKQLAEIKKEYQISASGRNKAELVAKLAERLSKGRGDGEKPEGESPSYADWGAGERESRKEMANPVTEPTTPEAEAAQPKEGDTPRDVAERVAAATDPNYDFARASAVSNLGEDLKGSARHKRNEWRGLAEAEKDGTAEAMVTRANLLKAEPHSLLANITPTNALPTLAAHLALNAFPGEPGEYPTALVARGGANTPTSAEGLRAQFFEAYREIKKEAEDAATSETDPRKVAERIRAKTKELIHKFRGYGGESSIARISATDSYNPVANGLVSLYNRTAVMRRPKTTDVMGRVMDFVGRAQQAYPGDPSAETLDKIMGHVSDIIEGDSFNKTFGTDGSKIARFDPAEAYVAHAERKGGRVIDAKTVESGSKFMMDTLKLRGLQWGNSVTDDERVHHLTKSAEAFADLSEMVGLPDEAISLGGALGLAIGARGKAGARAHYEPDTQVINLTRASGVGSLAHEWGHGLDHFLGGFGTWPSERHMKDDPIGAAMIELRTTMHGSGYTMRLRKEVNDRIKEGKLPKNALDYWASGKEMFARTFERHIQNKLHKADRENTYLTGLRKVGHPLWPNQDEVEKIAPAMEKLFDAIRQKHFAKKE